MIVIRYLFGFRNQALVANAISIEAQRTDPSDIADYLEANEALLDVDLDGKSAPLSDGLLIIRRLFGFSGEPLLSNAVGTDAQRAKSSEIEEYIDGLSLP